MFQSNPVWSGLVVGPASVYQAMSQLRKILGDAEEPARYIETVARKGYRLIAKVSKPEAVPRPEPPSKTADAGGPQAEAVPPSSVKETAAKKPWRWIALAATASLVVAALLQWYPRGAE